MQARINTAGSMRKQQAKYFPVGKGILVNDYKFNEGEEDQPFI